MHSKRKRRHPSAACGFCCCLCCLCCPCCLCCHCLACTFRGCSVEQHRAVRAARWRRRHFWWRGDASAGAGAGATPTLPLPHPHLQVRRRWQDAERQAVPAAALQAHPRAWHPVPVPPAWLWQGLRAAVRPGDARQALQPPPLCVWVWPGASLQDVVAAPPRASRAPPPRRRADIHHRPSRHTASAQAPACHHAALGCGGGASGGGDSGGGGGGGGGGGRPVTRPRWRWAHGNYRHTHRPPAACNNHRHHRYLRGATLPRQPVPDAPCFSAWVARRRRESHSHSHVCAGA